MNGMWVAAYTDRGTEVEMVVGVAELAWWANRLTGRGFNVMAWPLDVDPDAFDVPLADVAYWPADVVDVIVEGDVL